MNSIRNAIDVLERASQEGIVELYKNASTDNAEFPVAESWRSFLEEHHGFELRNGLDTEVDFVNFRGRGANQTRDGHPFFLMMDHWIGLTGESTWGWKCQIVDGNLGPVWYLQDFEVQFGYPSFERWLESYLDHHREWLREWTAFDCPSRDSETWDELTKNYDELGTRIGEGKKQPSTFVDRIDISTAELGTRIELRNVEVIPESKTEFRICKQSFWKRMSLLLTGKKR